MSLQRKPKGWDQTVTSRTTTFTLAYTSSVKRAAAFKNYSGAPWLFWGYGFLQLGHKTDFIKLFVQPGHREAVTHKYLPQVVYNSATVSCTPISAAEYIHSIKALSSEHSSVQHFKQPKLEVFIFRQQWSWPLVEEGTRRKHWALWKLLSTQRKNHTFISKVAINIEALSRPLPTFWRSPQLLFTPPALADRIDLSLLERINMAYFDDRVGISSAFSLPKHYAIAAEGNWVALNGRWQNGELSNSFQPLAAHSIIKIIKKKGGGEWRREGKSATAIPQ